MPAHIRSKSGQASPFVRCKDRMRDADWHWVRLLSRPWGSRCSREAVGPCWLPIALTWIPASLIRGSIGTRAWAYSVLSKSPTGLGAGSDDVNRTPFLESWQFVQRASGVLIAL